MPQRPADRFFGALNQAYDAMLQAIEKGNQRGYRVSRTILRQARRGEREVVALAKKWVEEPTDVLGFYETLLDAQTRAQTRALELTREWLEEAGNTREEVQEALRRMIQANRDASEAAIEAARGAFEGTVDRVRGREAPAVEEAPPPARREARRAQPAKATQRRAPRRRAAARPRAAAGPAPAAEAPEEAAPAEAEAAE